MNVNSFIDNFGSDVTLKTRSTTIEDDLYGTVTESFTESTIKAIISFVKKEKKLDKPGEIPDYDAVAYVKSSVSVSPNDAIVYGSDEFRIVEIEEDSFRGEIKFKKLKLKR